MKRMLFSAGLLLAVAGGALIWLAAITPWHTDADAYFAGLNAIRDRLYGDERGDFDVASDAFHALQDKYRTTKWLYADLGYAAVAWAALLAAMAVFRPNGQGTRSLWSVLSVTLAGAGLMVVGVIASGVQSIGREQVPVWADTPIFLLVAMNLAVVFIPLMLALAMSPLIFTKRQPAGLFALKGRGWVTSLITTLIYAPPIALGAVTLIAIVEPGGWAFSTGGALLIGSMLNARAVWLGRSPQAQPLP